MPCAPPSPVVSGTAAEMLNKIPMQETKNNEAVKVLGRGEAEVYINRNLSFVWQNDIDLPKGWRLNASMQCATRGDYNNNRITRGRFYTDFGVQRDFNLNRMGQLTTSFYCFDPFNTNTTDAIIYGIRELTVHNPARRTFRIELSWKFNEARSKYRGSGAGDKQKARM